KYNCDVKRIHLHTGLVILFQALSLDFLFPLIQFQRPHQRIAHVVPPPSLSSSPHLISLLCKEPPSLPSLLPPSLYLTLSLHNCLPLSPPLSLPPHAPLCLSTSLARTLHLSLALTLSLSV